MVTKLKKLFVLFIALALICSGRGVEKHHPHIEEVYEIQPALVPSYSLMATGAFNHTAPVFNAQGVCTPAIQNQAEGLILSDCELRSEQCTALKARGLAPKVPRSC